MLRTSVPVLSTLAAAGVLAAAALAASAAAPGRLLLFERRDVIPAPDVDFARVADLDGDRDLDFLAVESGGNNVDWYENADGRGMDFDHKHSISRSSGGVTIVSPADADGDSDADFFALPENGRVEVWLNDGRGSFTKHAQTISVGANVTYIEAADVDGDGDADLFTVDTQSDRIEWWSNGPPAFAFARHPVATNASTYDTVARLEAADVDRDGLVDFVTADPAGGRVAWWRHTVEMGEHRFANTGGFNQAQAKDSAAADFDGDGDIDLFVLRMMPYRVFGWPRGADGSFGPPGPWLAEAEGNLTWTSVDHGDVNGDGAVDFVVAEPGSGGRLCWYQNPSSVPTAPAPTTPPPSPTHLVGTNTPGPTPTATRPPTEGPTPTPTTPAPTATRTATRAATATSSIPVPTCECTSTPTSATPAPTDPSLRFRAHVPLALRTRR